MPNASRTVPAKTRQTTRQRLHDNAVMLREIYSLIKTNKKWWLMPIFLVFAAISFLMVIFGGSSILPAIYALF